MKGIVCGMIVSQGCWKVKVNPTELNLAAMVRLRSRRRTPVVKRVDRGGKNTGLVVSLWLGHGDCTVVDSSG